MIGGLPYATVDVDVHGYCVVCPLCGERCRAEGAMGHDTDEDNVTKGASRVYALHYEKEHADG